MLCVEEKEKEKTKVETNVESRTEFFFFSSEKIKDFSLFSVCFYVDVVQ